MTDVEILTETAKQASKQACLVPHHIPLNGQSRVGLREINGSCSSFVYCKTRSVLVNSWKLSIICRMPYCDVEKERAFSMCFQAIEAAQALLT